MQSSLLIAAHDETAPRFAKFHRAPAPATRPRGSRLGWAVSIALLLCCIAIALFFSRAERPAPPPPAGLPISVTTLVGHWSRYSSDDSTAIEIRWLGGRQFEISARHCGWGTCDDWSVYRGDLTPLASGHYAVGAFTGTGPLGDGGQWLVGYHSQIPTQDGWQGPFLRICSNAAGFISQAIAQNRFNGTITKEEDGVTSSFVEDPAQFQVKLDSMVSEHSDWLESARCTSLWRRVRPSTGGPR